MQRGCRKIWQGPSRAMELMMTITVTGQVTNLKVPMLLTNRTNRQLSAFRLICRVLIQRRAGLALVASAPELLIACARLPARDNTCLITAEQTSRTIQCSKSGLPTRDNTCLITAEQTSRTIQCSKPGLPTRDNTCLITSEQTVRFFCRPAWAVDRWS